MELSKAVTPLSQTSSLVLVADKGLSYTSPKAREFLSYLDLSEGEKMYRKVQHLQPYLDEVIPNRKFIIHNYIREILNKKGPLVQVLVLACGWDPILVKMSEEFPENPFFGVDSESVNVQKGLVQKIMPKSPIFYLHANISEPQKLIQQLLDTGWKKDRDTLIVIEGICYYIPPKNFWETLKTLRENIQGSAFMCGDFLLDWDKQKISPELEHLAKFLFDMIKEACSQEYYRYTTKQFQTQMEELNFSPVQFYTQQEIQKLRTGESKPWKPLDGHIQLFTT